MPTHGKKYRGKVEGVDLSQRFSVEDAVSKSLAASYAKFDETVDVALKLGIPIRWCAEPCPCLMGLARQ